MIRAKTVDVDEQNLHATIRARVGKRFQKTRMEPMRSRLIGERQYASMGNADSQSRDQPAILLRVAWGIASSLAERPTEFTFCNPCGLWICRWSYPGFRSHAESKSIMQSQPLFIIGAPRSGTTFLCNALNQHPLIQLTNECRSFALLKHLMESCAVRPDLVGEAYQQAFLTFMRQNAGGLIEQFYRDALGITAPIWGDKHPPYADPCLLSGRQGSQPQLPQSGSCLSLIAALLPSAKFLHIQRDAEQVARSLVRKGWTPSLADGLHVWRQYNHEIAQFLHGTDPRRHITITYDALLTAPEATATSIGRFLALPDCTEIAEFLIDQHARPTPFSDPSTDLAMTYRGIAARRPRPVPAGRAAY